MRSFVTAAFITVLAAATLLSISFSSNASSEKNIPTVSATPKTIPVKTGLTVKDEGVYDLVEFDGQRLERPEDEWKKLLTPFQFSVLRQAATEAPYTGALTDNHENGVYYCEACGLAVFRSKAKFESGTGWPSFYEPIYKKNVVENEDRSLPGEVRTEVLCARCHSHLGHVFDDGPEPTGLRYCMNSAALKFKAVKH